MSFANPRQPARRGVPLAPMLDVLFLLLIFFAMTSSIRATEQMIPLQVPAARTGESEEGRRNETIVNVKGDDQILVNGRPQEPAALHTLLSELVAEFPNERVIIRGDTNASHGRIMTVFDVARRAGIRDVRVATSQPRGPGGG